MTGFNRILIGAAQMKERTTAYIGIGSNLGDRERYIESSVKMLGGVPELRFLRVSSVIETASLSGDGQPRYLNAVAEVETELDAQGLLKTLGEIETLLGRIRKDKWQPRTIDLDLLLFGEGIVSEPNLTVPHPQMHLRSFVLKGLCELNSDLAHPVLGVTVCELAERLNGLDFVPDAERAQLVCVAGLIGVGKTTLAEKLAKEFGGELLREPYDTNPYLPQVYAGRTELALDSQLYFLDGRIKQLDKSVLVPGRIVVSDYVFDKELIYARRLLSEKQLALYEDIHASMAGKAARPVLVIYLRDTVGTCLERIHRRNRPYEQRIENAFLEALNEDYERLFANWTACPVIRLNSSELDYSQTSTVEDLANQIKYYVTGPSVMPSKRALRTPAV
jgi:2-amino-4-hydroxy-6-hydroxymethyldihydropteridine diphosphokinase